MSSTCRVFLAWKKGGDGAGMLGQRGRTCVGEGRGGEPHLGGCAARCSRVRHSSACRCTLSSCPGATPTCSISSFRHSLMTARSSLNLRWRGTARQGRGQQAGHAQLWSRWGPAGDTCEGRAWLHAPPLTGLATLSPVPLAHRSPNPYTFTHPTYPARLPLPLNPLFSLSARPPWKHPPRYLASGRFQ